MLQLDTIFTVVHLETDQIYQQEHILANTNRAPLALLGEAVPAIEAFHRTSPEYAETPVRSLPTWLVKWEYLMSSSNMSCGQNGQVPWHQFCGICVQWR